MMASRYKQKTNVQKANRYKTNKNVRKASRHKKHTCGQQTATTKTSVHQANRYKTNKNVRKASRHKKQTCGQQTVTKNKRAESKPVPKSKRAESKPAQKANPKLFLSFIASETRFVLQLYMLAWIQVTIPLWLNPTSLPKPQKWNNKPNLKNSKKETN